MENYLYTAKADEYIFEKQYRKDVIFMSRFFTGVMMGAAVGIAVSAAMLQQARPDVTRKMIRDGKHFLKQQRNRMPI